MRFRDFRKIDLVRWKSIPDGKTCRSNVGKCWKKGCPDPVAYVRMGGFPRNHEIAFGLTICSPFYENALPECAGNGSQWIPRNCICPYTSPSICDFHGIPDSQEMKMLLGKRLSKCESGASTVIHFWVPRIESRMCFDRVKCDSRISWKSHLDLQNAVPGAVPFPTFPDIGATRFSIS